MAEKHEHSEEKVFLYSKTNTVAGKRLQRVLETFVTKENLEVFMTIVGLFGRLRQPGDNRAISVLFANDAQDLLDLYSHRDLFSDIRIIMILPDRNSETVGMGHSLHPRFITYSDSDFVEVGAVLNKMLNKSQL